MDNVVPQGGSLWERQRSVCPQVWGSSTAAWRCRYPEDSPLVYTAALPPRLPCRGSVRFINHIRINWCFSCSGLSVKLHEREFIQVKKVKEVPGSRLVPATAPVRGWTSPTEWPQTSRCQTHERNYETSETLEHTWTDERTETQRRWKTCQKIKDNFVIYS